MSAARNKPPRRGGKPGLPSPNRTKAVVAFVAVAAGGIALAVYLQRPSNTVPTSVTNSNEVVVLTEPTVTPTTNDAVPLTLETADPQTLFQTGTDLLHAGNAKQALPLLARAAELNAEDAEVQFNLAYALARLGQTEPNPAAKSRFLAQAIAKYEATLKLDPDYAEAHINLGNIYRGQRNYFEATKHFSSALRAMPDHSVALNSMGHCLAAQGNTDEAISYFSQAVLKDPNYLEARFNLGQAFMQLGRKDEAVVEFKAALKIDPNFQPAAQALAAAMRKN